MRLQYSERQPTQRIVEQRDLRESSMGDDESSAIARISLPMNFANSPGYWKGKLLHAQAIVKRRFLANIFISISMNPPWDVLQSNEIDVSISPGLRAPRTRPGLFDWLDLAKCVYNQFANTFMNTWSPYCREHTWSFHWSFQYDTIKVLYTQLMRLAIHSFIEEDLMNIWKMWPTMVFWREISL